ncbi:MAG: KH domain-containing protein [bacterium]
MAEKEADQEFVEYVVKQLVTKPEAVVTTRKIDELGVLIELTVDREDMGVIIGKEGKTAKSIRTLLRVLGAKIDSRINLKIVEPEGGEAPVKVAKTEEVEEQPVVAEVVVEEDDDEAPMADLDL